MPAASSSTRPFPSQEPSVGRTIDRGPRVRARRSPLIALVLLVAACTGTGGPAPPARRPARRSRRRSRSARRPARPHPRARVPGHRDRRRGDGGHDRDRAGLDRVAPRPPRRRRCSRSAWVTGSWASPRTSSCTRPRPARSRTWRSSARWTSRRILGFEPDVVIAGGLGFTPGRLIARLRELDVPVVVICARRPGRLHRPGAHRRGRRPARRPRR